MSTNLQITANLIALVFIVQGCQVEKPPAYPPYFIDKTEEMPDILMTDVRLHLPDGGGYFCGPVSVVNSFHYLNNHGFPELIPDHDSYSLLQIEKVILKLSDNEHMCTMANKITPKKYMIRGIKHYMDETGYELSDIGYEKFDKLNPHSSNVKLEWLKSRLYTDYEIVLFVLVTKQLEGQNNKILAGHWVSLAGYGLNTNGELNQNCFIIQDPGSDSSYKKNDHVELRLMEENCKTQRINFKNWLELKDYDCKNGGDAIFLGGALFFKIKEI